MARWGPVAGRCAALAVLLAVGMRLFLMPATDAAAEAPEAASLIDIVLHPGWNAVAWLGPDAPAATLFEAVPEIVAVSAWDAAEQRWLRAYRDIEPSGPALRGLARGAGLRLYVAAAGPVTWTRTAAEDGVLLELREGWNLVGWTGRDGAPAAEAFARFGRTLGVAMRRDDASGRTEEYPPRSPDDRAGELRELRRGDVFWVRLTADARWWQSGTGPHPVVFLGDVAEDERARIRRSADEARATYAERWGVEAAFRGYAGDPRGLAMRYLEARGRPLPAGFCADYETGVAFAVADCVGPGDWARAYFGALRDDLSDGRAAQAPAWLAAGAEVYAEAVAGARPAGVTVEQRLARERRLRAAALPHRDGPTLASLETLASFGGQGAVGEDQAFLAVDWLVGQSSERSVVAFFEALADPSATWEEAFRSAFGVTPADFREAFGAHLAVIAAARYADDGTAHQDCDRQVDTTVATLVFQGAVPAAAQARTRSWVDAARAVFARRWCVEAGFEAYTGDRVSLAAKHQEVRGFPLPGFCGNYGNGVIFVVLDCASERLWAHEYFHALQDSLRGYRVVSIPSWLIEGTAEYAEAVQQAAVSDDFRSRMELLAGAGLPPLATLEESSAFYGWGDGAYNMGFVAAHWLVGHSVEVAIVDFFEALADPSATWREAFRSAFGVTAADFYATFEAYRDEHGF